MIEFFALTMMMMMMMMMISSVPSTTLKNPQKIFLWYRHKRKTPTPSKSNSSKKVDSFLDWTIHRAICGAGNCKLELIKWGCLVRCCTPNSVSIHGIYCVLHGFLRILTHKYPIYRAYIGISHRGTLVGVHPCLSPKENRRGSLDNQKKWGIVVLVG